jgi:hypothetical protein
VAAHPDARCGPPARRAGGAMTFHVDTPEALLLFALVPLFFVRRGGGRTRRAALLATLLRSVAAVLVIELLAGVHLERPRPEAGTCLVAAIDVSTSVQRAGVERAREVLDTLVPRLGPEDLIGSLAFATRPHVIAYPVRGIRETAALLPPPASDVTGLESGDTDLAAAFTTASALCPVGKERALLLFSDGNETEGSLQAEVVRTSGWPVFVFVPDAAALPSAVIRRVLAPTFAPEHTVLPLELVVESRAADPLPAELQLIANGEPLTRERTRLAPGLNVIALPYRLRGAGQYALEAELVLPTVTTPALGRSRGRCTC